MIGDERVNHGVKPDIAQGGKERAREEEDRDQRPARDAPAQREEEDDQQEEGDRSDIEDGIGNVEAETGINLHERVGPEEFADVEPEVLSGDQSSGDELLEQGTYAERKGRLFGVLQQETREGGKSKLEAMRADGVAMLGMNGDEAHAPCDDEERDREDGFFLFDAYSEPTDHQEQRRLQDTGCRFGEHREHKEKQG